MILICLSRYKNKNHKMLVWLCCAVLGKVGNLYIEKKYQPKICFLGSLAQAESGGEGEGESPPGGEGVWSIARQEESSGIHPTTSFKELRISQSHSKKVIKHALRQQAKRRRKNTTIAAGNSAPLPRILVPPQCECTFYLVMLILKLISSSYLDRCNLRIGLSQFILLPGSNHYLFIWLEPYN